MKGIFYFLIFSLLLFPCLFGKDTGTYEILEYRVKLAPQENGVVRIDYFQRWKVTGGHIPWVTVGAYHSDYSLVKDGSGGNVRRIQKADSRSWYGVRIDLDRDYKPGETFEVRYAILQRGLFSPDGEYYRLRFTPGWYDRGRIGKLIVEVEFFADLKGVKAGPQPDRVEGRRLAWEKKDLSPGAKFPVSMSIPRSLFPGELVAAKKPVRKAKRRGKDIGVILLVIIGLPMIGIVIVAIKYGRKGGRYGGGGRVGRGGTGFIGRGCVVSCACACVACACACACAGGGAAGCDRKLAQTCPLCAHCERRIKGDCPLFKNGDGHLF